MKQTDPRKVSGDKGEELVAQQLQQEGFVIVARNWAKSCGEVDLIAESQEMILFVEVKTRVDSLFDLTEVIGRAKQRRIIAAAKIYLSQHGYPEKIYRFDVALIENLERGTITYIPNAFTEPEW